MNREPELVRPQSTIEKSLDPADGRIEGQGHGKKFDKEHRLHQADDDDELTAYNEAILVVQNYDLAIPDSYEAATKMTAAEVETLIKVLEGKEFVGDWHDANLASYIRQGVGREEEIIGALATLTAIGN